ncbi:dihydroorotate dehydrogenase (quinone) [Flavipsychrobacter stenotrophus]|uniref:Dihydroorotate dehydrogenase (quinone) n=1 Tax=Flavipsychrobacter stenotrophus TaxID=2077091 RepID=A0A2S7T0J3_9BACT|nr:quinone-dependent dihydroorotate dehydrogenase [Flavipsychrobacter stenotrophus]PQJ12377.1 dihydroorotate dehydrogenase (quinone) [Flavipsychrobacter stenotrophus]
MYKLIRSILFKVDPETVHTWVMGRLKMAYNMPMMRRWMIKRYAVDEPSLSQTLWGITFPNPVGLAAGFDKNAEYIDPLACLGFGFIEVGTVTPRGQGGNAKPRMFRLPADGALINRMGFNNKGANSAGPRIKRRKENVVIGGNIGKNKETPNERADDDYEQCFEFLYKAVDYFVVNVSSPNTPGLRALQEKQPLTNLLMKLQKMNYELGEGKPILLKIAPDLTNEQLDDIIDIVRTTKLHGIVATNTTINREGLHTATSVVEGFGAGGLSGLPLKQRSTEVVRYISERSNGQIPIIAVGGIFTAEDAIEKLEAGASLVQVYTGFIYQGPSIAKDICEGLIKNGHFSKKARNN